MESAHFIAEHVPGNVRELEGALNEVIATAKFTGAPVTLDLVKEALRDLTGKKRNRGIVRPREMAMALSRELTQNSYPEIGQAFDGRDHSTVTHACVSCAQKSLSSTRIICSFCAWCRLEASKAKFSHENRRNTFD